MRRIGYKPVRYAVAALGAVALAAPVPAFASPATPTPAGTAATATAPGFASLAVPPRTRPLTEALLTTDDLPAGYQTMTGGGGMSVVSAINTDADMCDQQIGTTAGVQKEPTAGAAFLKNGAGPMLFESLTAVGKQAAVDIVSAVAIAPHQCPTVVTTVPTSGRPAHLTLTPLRVRRMGDAAAGMAFTVKLPDTGVTVQGKMITAAYQDVAITIMLIGVPEVTPQEANTITAAAVRKLRRTH